MTAMALIAEALGLIKPGIELTGSLFALFGRAKEIAAAPAPATPDELAAFKVMLDAEKARLDANTAEIEKD